ncbi:hypothetical protein BD413DRAFT_251819 [Trametes elegans]|nr:hypothetical protein BD413DRAFT_251819 [Trametes elegans]
MMRLALAPCLFVCSATLRPPECALWRPSGILSALLGCLRPSIVCSLPSSVPPSSNDRQSLHANRLHCDCPAIWTAFWRTLSSSGHYHMITTRCFCHVARPSRPGGMRPISALFQGSSRCPPRACAQRALGNSIGNCTSTRQLDDVCCSQT